MRALLAFDKFKESLTAAGACEVAAEALRDAHPDWSVDVCPLTDGGEGFAGVLTRASGGTLHRVAVQGPRGRSVVAEYGRVASAALQAAVRRRLGEPRAALNGQGAAQHASTAADLAVIEMAQASGLWHVSPDARNPLRSSTFGTGELIRHAIEAGAQGILLGVGGSATNDLGLGALAALGVTPVDAQGAAVVPCTPDAWPRIAGFERRGPERMPPIWIACDVTNPLLGPTGCAAVFGPQKGLRPEQLAALEAESERIARLLCSVCARPVEWMHAPGAGAAGGIAFGLGVALSASLVPGFELVYDWLDLEQRISAADIVLTGEGRFDSTSLSGKGPGAIAQRGVACGKQVHVFAGSCAAALPGAHVHAINPPGVPLAVAISATSENLRRAVARL